MVSGLLVGRVGCQRWRTVKVVCPAVVKLEPVQTCVSSSSEDFLTSTRSEGGIKQERRITVDERLWST